MVGPFNVKFIEDSFVFCVIEDMKCLTVLLTFSFSLILTSEAVKKIPSYVKLCKRNDPNLSKCWRESFEALRPYLLKGIPEFNLPPIDPMRISELTLNQPTSSNVFFNAVLKDLELSGGKDFTVLDNFIKLDDVFFWMKLHFPKLVMNSQYKGKGRVLLFEIDSDGKTYGEFSDVVLNATWTGYTFKKKGKDYITVVPEDVDVKVGKIYIRFDDLIKGNPQITDSINEAINENIDLLYNDFLPLLKQTLGTVVTEYSNRVSHMFSADELYPSD